MENFGWFLYLNVLTFIVYGVDKYKAKHNQWRISEKTLLGLAAAGGSIGAWAGMMVFRHKTQHLKFKLGVPVLLLLQAAVGVYWLWK